MIKGQPNIQHGTRNIQLRSDGQMENDY